MEAENTLELKEQVETDVLRAMKKPTGLYWVTILSCFLLFNAGFALWGYQIMEGIGVAGKNNPVGWALYITTFVFWVGIAHSGTLISAVLFLFRAKFRSRFNRSAEAMTLFAIMTAGLFPLIHLGRVWRFYYLFPYPTQRLLWINFKSPLVWDVFAVNTYLTISAIFFYIGIIPDLSIARRHSTGIKRVIYNILSLGWIGSDKQWKHYNQLYMFLAAFATPLVVSVHSVVSWDFAMSIVPGWHTTIFAPYFVAGAIFSGTAMVITLIIPMRKFYKLDNLITIKHMELLAKVLLFTSIIVTYAYIVEFGLAFYGDNIFESAIFSYRVFGYYKYCYYLMVLCNCIIPLALFVKSIRTNIKALFIISILVNVGMYLERFVIIVTSLSHEYLPYAWGNYKPTLVDMGIVLGSFGWFFFLFLIFVKVLPVIAMTEVKEEYEKH
jgi:Ni/Fe-hydrogenase subunit HybB-like protein